jgi:hypothetical protein
MKEFYLDTYACLQQRATGLKNDMAFHDISSIFSDVHEPIYVDFDHMGERGNSLIARRMVEDFVLRLGVNSKTGGRNDEPEQIDESAR